MSVRDRIKRMEQMAMLEKEQAPDERGRSPGGVSMASNTSASGSPRPLSKVRTSFVAIADKDGRIGLTRQPSGDSSISGRKLSGDTAASSSSNFLNNIHEETISSNVLSSSPDAIRVERTRGPSASFSRAALQDAGPGSTRSESEHPPAGTPSAPRDPSSGPASGLTGSVADSEAAKPAQPAEATKSSEPAGPATTSGSLSGSLADSKPSRAAPNSLAAGPGNQTGQKGQESPKGLAASPQIKEASRQEGAASQRASGRTGAAGQHLGSGTGASRNASSGLRAAGQAQGVEESKAQRAGDQSQAETKGHQNALDRGGDKGRSTGASAGGLNGADKAKTTKPAPASSTQPKQAGKVPEAKGLTTPAAEKKITEKKAVSSNVSPPFVKPRPKSPTQPVKLSERLTNHTTASATRTKNGAPPAARPASRTSNVSGRTLGRSASMTGKQHASFGPPPKQTEHTTPKDSKPVDESFLARMMRPTQAYANKVADKTQMTPKTPPHATTTRKTSSARNGPTRKVAKSMPSSAATSPDPKKSEQPSGVKHAVKKVVKPIAEETLSVAKRVEKKPSFVRNGASAERVPKQEEPIKSTLPETTESNVEAAKPIKQSLPQAAETKQEAPVAVDKEADAAQPSGKTDDTALAASQIDEPALPAEKEVEKEAEESEKENIPDMSENVDVSQSNGDFAEKSAEPSLSEDAKTEAKAPQPFVSFDSLQPQQDEQEEW